MNNLNRWYMFIVREFWEHKIGFVYIPAGAALLTFLTLMLVLINLNSEHLQLPEQPIAHSSGNPIHEMDKAFTEEYQQQGGSNYKEDINNYLTTTPLSDTFEQLHMSQAGAAYIVEPFLILLGSIIFSFTAFVMVGFLLTSQSNEIRDKSINFWATLPVSNGEIILTKLITAVVILPIITLVCVTLLQLLTLALLNIFYSDTAFAHAIFWSDLSILRLFSINILTTLTFIIHSLPIAAILIFASGFGRLSFVTFLIVLALSIAVSVGLPSLPSAISPLSVLFIHPFFEFAPYISKHLFLTWQATDDNYSLHAFWHGFIASFTLIKLVCISAITSLFLYLATKVRQKQLR